MDPLSGCLFFNICEGKTGVAFFNVPVAALVLPFGYRHLSDFSLRQYSKPRVDWSMVQALLALHFYFLNKKVPAYTISPGKSLIVLGASRGPDQAPG